MNTVVSTKLYAITDSQEELLLSMAVGKAQISSSSIRLNAKLIEANLEGGFENQKIGINKDLDNSMLTIDVTVKDVNPQTNETLIDVKLTGGKSDHIQRYSETANADGAIVH